MDLFDEEFHLRLLYGARKILPPIDNYGLVDWKWCLGLEMTCLVHC